MKEFVIDRAKWLIAKPHDSCLLNNEGKMCCLGFLAKALGADSGDIRDQKCPEYVVSFVDWPEFLLVERGNEIIDSPTAGTLMKINDDKKEPKARREKRIAKIFAENGWNVTFVGEYP